MLIACSAVTDSRPLLLQCSWPIMSLGVLLLLAACVATLGFVRTNFRSCSSFVIAVNPTANLQGPIIHFNQSCHVYPRRFLGDVTASTDILDTWLLAQRLESVKVTDDISVLPCIILYLLRSFVSSICILLPSLHSFLFWIFLFLFWMLTYPDLLLIKCNACTFRKCLDLLT